MFCSTFYSYKGGVGRTLALANVACVLAREGKRVLLVDFDLEAPGLVTLPEFEGAAAQPGIVDLIEAYVVDRVVPNAADFIHRCEIQRNFIDEAGNPDNVSFCIDVMPAGLDGEDGYSTRLNRIDWNLLYDKQDGFVMMEDIREQWAASGYDYVLIDSRTGLTDVGGICTRHLPDAVVAVFFPNEQNLVGMKQVARSIRSAGARPDPIELQFVASRVPRLDDEHGHLRRWLKRFSSELEYSPDSVQIVEHYDSMMLLNQTLFVLDRPQSGLAGQYCEIASRIKRLNNEDADGVLQFLNSEFRGTEGAQRLLEGNNPQRLEKISHAHPFDSVVQFAVARQFYRMRDLTKAEQACNRSIDAEGASKVSKRKKSWSDATVRHLRLRILSELGRQHEAVEDAKMILQEASLPHSSLVDAVLALASNDPAALADPLSLPAIAAAPAEQLLSLSSNLSRVESMQKTAAIIAETALQNDNDFADESDITELQLVLIAGGRLESAVERGDEVDSEIDIHVSFNTAIAAWGVEGRPDKDRWRHLKTLFDQVLPASSGANFEQCRALAAAVLQELDAMDEALSCARNIIRAQRHREYSCWTYEMVASETFEEHLDAISAFGRDGGPPPPVVLARD